MARWVPLAGHRLDEPFEGEQFSIGKLAAILLQFATETRLFEHRAIHNTAWNSSVLNVEHSPDVGCTISSEALIGPAKCVRRHDDIVEHEERIGRTVGSCSNTSRAAPAIRPLARTSVSAF